MITATTIHATFFSLLFSYYFYQTKQNVFVFTSCLCFRCCPAFTSRSPDRYCVLFLPVTYFCLSRCYCFECDIRVLDFKELDEIKVTIEISVGEADLLSVDPGMEDFRLLSSKLRSSSVYCCMKRNPPCYRVPSNCFNEIPRV